MKSEIFSVKSNDTSFHVKRWVSDSKPKAVIQISHGMAEHIERYGHFAKRLVQKGYAVYGNDHRGHGKTAENEEDLGFFAEQNGWNLVVEDMHILNTMIKEQFPGLPVFIFGHSMGSFLTRRYIQLHGEKINGVILSGSGGDGGLLGKLGVYVVKNEVRRKGVRGRSPHMNKLIFGKFNKRFRPNRTEFDWISRDKNEVDKYIKDPYTGGICTASFYYDMLLGIQELHRMKNIKLTPKALPMYFISGDKDPLSNFGKDIIDVVKTYQDVGVQDVTYKLYKNARHELLNELNADEVMSDIMEWLDGKISILK
ncbi:alpha/beta hydrolase [Chengkuizengella axinellae]|uniref:Lysophospholipase n=1 Tax=Chengkuizengella axinellae TaxID=3064388 RepID=A0ABT9IXP4_9BACL|nr:alpha/beta hydrolase [Chengkuizengella sp. 2205SS18-9]MDP5274132.1 lysophospholipase [Chengkuizengella sp. 2205SS18-9]